MAAIIAANKTVFILADSSRHHNGTPLASLASLSGPISRSCKVSGLGPHLWPVLVQVRSRLIIVGNNDVRMATDQFVQW